MANGEKPQRYVYVADKLARAESPYAGQVCERAGAWIRGKAPMRFVESGDLVVCLVGNGRMRKVAA